MTRITIYRHQETFRGFECESHAGYAEEGSDIVCAAISVLVINTINSITELVGCLMDVEADEDNAYIRADFVDAPTPEADLLMRSMILGLSGIEDDPKTAEFVDMIFEEVN